MRLSADTSLWYKFVFSVKIPTNSDILQVNFIRQPQDGSVLSKLISYDSNHANETLQGAYFTCDHSSGKSINSTQAEWTIPHESDSLALSLANAWAGCNIENRRGQPTYTCEGGVTFQSPRYSCHV